MLPHYMNERSFRKNTKTGWARFYIIGTYPDKDDGQIPAIGNEHSKEVIDEPGT